MVGDARDNIHTCNTLELFLPVTFEYIFIFGFVHSLTRTSSLTTRDTTATLPDYEDII